jgi:hypothetical protein
MSNVACNGIAGERVPVVPDLLAFCCSNVEVEVMTVEPAGVR